MSALHHLRPITRQTAFNLDRWDELAHDDLVRNWPGKVETDRFGRTIMYHYADESHGGKQFDVGYHLRRLLPHGRVTVECPISTSEGIKVPDVIWISPKRYTALKGRAALKGAPEICVEVLSPSNKRGEIEEKRRLYFEAGAEEFWLCDTRGRMQFFLKADPETAQKTSTLCPEMPRKIED